MKITPYILLGIIAFFACCKNSSHRNDIQSENLKGKIHQVTTAEYEAVEKFGEVMKGKKIYNTIEKFNNKGYIVQVENTAIFDDSIPPDHYIIKRIYNDKNQQIEYTGFSKDSKFKGEFKYGINDQPVEINMYDNGKFTSKDKFDYDENSLAKTVNSFDEHGRRISKLSYRRNSKGLIEQVIKYDSTGSIENQQFITYDDNNLPIKTRLSGKYGFTHTYKYSRFDKNGNWLTMIQINDGKPSTITERKILYY